MYTAKVTTVRESKMVLDCFLDVLNYYDLGLSGEIYVNNL